MTVLKWEEKHRGHRVWAVLGGPLTWFSEASPPILRSSLNLLWGSLLFSPDRAQDTQPGMKTQLWRGGEAMRHEEREEWQLPRSRLLWANFSSSPTSFQIFSYLVPFWSKQVNISCLLWFLKDKILENKKSLLFYI